LGETGKSTVHEATQSDHGHVTHISELADDQGELFESLPRPQQKVMIDVSCETSAPPLHVNYDQPVLQSVDIACQTDLETTRPDLWDDTPHDQVMQCPSSEASKLETTTCETPRCPWLPVDSFETSSIVGSDFGSLLTLPTEPNKQHPTRTWRCALDLPTQRIARIMRSGRRAASESSSSED